MRSVLVQAGDRDFHPDRTFLDESAELLNTPGFDD